MQFPLQSLPFQFGRVAVAAQVQQQLDGARHTRRPLHSSLCQQMRHLLPRDIWEIVGADAAQAAQQRLHKRVWLFHLIGRVLTGNPANAFR